MSLNLVELLVSVHPGLKRSMVGVILDADTVRGQVQRFAHLIVLLTWPAGEAPLARDEQFLTTRELELGSPERLDDMGLVLILATHTDHGLTDVHTSHQTLGLAEGSSHSGLEPIGSGTGQHFVDAHDVERMDAKTHVESILTHELDHVLVGADTGGFQGLSRELFILIGDHVDAERELINASLLTTQVVNTNFGIGDTPAKPGLRVRFVLAVPIAPRRPATHLSSFIYFLKLKMYFKQIETTQL